MDAIVTRLAKQWAAKNDQALQDALTAYRDEHGRFPAYSWMDTPGSAASMMFPTDPPVVVHCGENRPTGPGARTVWCTGILNAPGETTSRDFVEDIGRGAGYQINTGEVGFDCPTCGAQVLCEREVWFDGDRLDWTCSRGHWGYAELDVLVMVRPAVEVGE